MKPLTLFAILCAALFFIQLFFTSCWGTEICYQFESRGEAVARKNMNGDNFGLRSGNTGSEFEPSVLPLDASDITFMQDLDVAGFRWVSFKSAEDGLPAIQKHYQNAHDCSKMLGTVLSRFGHQVICL
jgi:hypothetical protein